MASLLASDARSLMITYLEQPAATTYNTNPANSTDNVRTAADPGEGGIHYPPIFNDPVLPVANTQASGNALATYIQAFIQRYSAIRLCTFVQTVTDYSHGTGGHIHASTTVPTYQRYCMLKSVPSYASPIPSVGTIEAGAGLTAGSNADYGALSSYLSGTGAAIVAANIAGAGRTFNFCHSSCHSNCHNSGRNRR